jgi:hypothetical protein
MSQFSLAVLQNGERIHHAECCGEENALARMWGSFSSGMIGAGAAET